jgi:tripartite-type tricarboxylate transporter receptor subunit TctC
MKSLLGTVVVENQGGGGGSLGAAAVARAQPDGYTILLGGAGSLVVNPIASSRTPYDPIKDFEPIAMIAISALAVVVHPSVPVRSLKELIVYAKANPGKLLSGSSGVGSTAHLATELFKSLVGAPDIVHVPYKGAGPALADLISGHIPMATPNVTGQLLELHQTGQLRVLAVTTPARLTFAPDIPTAEEAGLPGMISQNFTGLFAPAGTPSAVVDRISDATRAAMGDSDFQRMMVATGQEFFVDPTPDKTRRFLAEDIGRWRPVIAKIGLKLD